MLLRVAAAGGNPREKCVRCQHGLCPASRIDDGHAVGLRVEKAASDMRDAVVTVAGRKRFAARDCVQVSTLRIPSPGRRLVVGRDAAFGRDILLGVGILQHELVEVHRWKRVDHHVAFRAPRVQAVRGIAVALDPEHVADAADILELDALACLIPQRDRSLLDHEHLQPMRLPLPEDVLVRFVEPHAAARGQAQEVRVVDGMERRMLLQEVGNSIGDD